MKPEIDLESILGRLKDFQRRTVEYVFDRMYLSSDPSPRFLVADEVGLGKTLVARGVIARAIEHLRREGIRRIDIVYVCSNAAIARQNVNRLNVFGHDHLAMATRLTMLPRELAGLNQNEVNFISFTPGTSFNLQSSGGIRDERILLFQLLKGEIDVSETSLMNVLQGAVRNRDRWREDVRAAEPDFDAELQRKFANQLTGNEDLVGRLKDACARFQRYRDNPGMEDVLVRNRVIRDLRLTLAHACVDALEPDLVILDEFQRFKDLLDGEDDAAQLAQTLFGYSNVHVLLLSATPYKMYTLDQEVQDDHYDDFVRTLRFLLRDDEAALARIKAELADYRKAIYGFRHGSDAAEVRDRIQDSLRAVMSRTERVAATRRQDAMLCEREIPTELAPSDLKQARFVGTIAAGLETDDFIEYWKSSPYLLNFMREYELKRQFDAAVANDGSALASVLKNSEGCLLPSAALERYAPIDPANPRLRALIGDTVSAGQWEVLWVPPSLPYIEPSGAYRKQAGMTKMLMFSAWRVAPDAVAALCSYEAERLMISRDGASLPVYSELGRARKALLRFSIESDGRPTGMPVLCLLYPSVVLASVVDPLQAAIAQGCPVQPIEIRCRTKELLRGQMEPIVQKYGSRDGRADQRWYWAAIALADAQLSRAAVSWLADSQTWGGCVSNDEDEPATAFVRHASEFHKAALGELDLGRPPDDLMEVLVEVALASPGVCALRALHRVADGMDFDDPVLMTSAAEIAAGFRTLFNLPETMALLRASEGDLPYWRAAIQHGIDGNLQAVLDEYAHTLRESLGVSERPVDEAVPEIADAIQSALSLRTSRITADEFRLDEERVAKDVIRFRSRFAMRLADIEDDAGNKIARADTVRQTFNSPFRPFILTTTSIGQEGLDLHTYCHVVYHWNLPPNPVDLEQREGRVHRYKGHAVRKNVATDIGLQGLSIANTGLADPWHALFEAAKSKRPAGTSDLVPYWIYETEGGARIERRVPMLPFSREERRLPRLKQSLAVYRLVFGQPRQEDLVSHLKWRAANGQDHLNDLRISLAPPLISGKRQLQPMEESTPKAMAAAATADASLVQASLPPPAPVPIHGANRLMITLETGTDSETREESEDSDERFTDNSSVPGTAAHDSTVLSRIKSALGRLADRLRRWPA